jgi:hypothetical protein
MVMGLPLTRAVWAYCLVAWLWVYRRVSAYRPALSVYLLASVYHPMWVYPLAWVYRLVLLGYRPAWMAWLSEAPGYRLALLAAVLGLP